MERTEQPLRVGVLGAGGKMGTMICQRVREAPDMELVAQVGSADSRDSLRNASVIVDFTNHDVVMDNLRWALDEGIHMVVGTSGFDDERLAEAARLSAKAPAVGLMIVPNFSVSAVFAMNFAAKAARHFGTIEIVELAHRRKLDAPSGTALRTAQMVAASRREAGATPEPDDTPPGSRGTRGMYVDGIRLHSIRLDGLLSHQKALLSRTGEMLTIGYDTMDREAFAPGVLMAVREVAARPGLTVGLEALLDL